MNIIIKKIFNKINYIFNKFLVFIIKILNFFLSFLGLKVLFKNEEFRFSKQIQIISTFYNNISKTTEAGHETNSISCIVFSMDRAMQLHSLLCSMDDKLDIPIPIKILYKASSSRHDKSYNDIISIFSNFNNIEFIKQKSNFTFKEQLINIINTIGSTKLFFLVDDIIIIEDIKVKNLYSVNCSDYIFTLRLGKNIVYSYNHRRKISLPESLSEEDNMITWDWTDGEADWQYPLSVDGHVFSKNEILAMTKSIDFNSPNSYEGAMQIFLPVFLQRIGVSYIKSRIVNIPINKVQNEINNLHGVIHQDDLLINWNKGLQIDLEKLYGFNNNSVHQEIPISFTKRI